jgi:hypothetical protein
VFPTGEMEGELVYDGAPSGEHLLAPESEEMQASFVVFGAGVAQGALLGRIRQVDAAPTLSALLGLGPPAASVGEVLAAALARSPKGPRAATR